MLKPIEYQRARAEHAWLLRAEGKTFPEISRRLGFSAQRARFKVFEFGAIVGWAIRKTQQAQRAAEVRHMWTDDSYLDD